QHHQSRSHSKIPTCAIASNDDLGHFFAGHSYASTTGFDDGDIDVKAFIQRVWIREFRRLFVVETQNRQACLSSPGKQLVIVASGVHSHESATRNVQDKMMVVLQFGERAIIIQPRGNGLFVVAVGRPWNADLSGWPSSESGSHETLQQTQVWRRSLVPSD